jgi:hypothetical protein
MRAGRRSPVVQVAVVGLWLAAVPHVLTGFVALALTLRTVEPRRRADAHPVLAARLRIVLIRAAHPSIVSSSMPC